MSKSSKNIRGTLSADVANNGTFTVVYPNKDAPETGVTNEGDFYNAVGHNLVIGSSNVFQFPTNFGLTFGTTNITVTNRTGATLRAGEQFTLELKERGDDVYAGGNLNPALDRGKMAMMCKLTPVLIKLGAVDAGVFNGVRTAAAGVMTAGVDTTLNGSLVVNGVAEFDVSRALEMGSSAAGDTTQVITVRGFDQYGVAMREDITLNGTTTVFGRKAFKRVTSVRSSATTTGNIAIGTGSRVGSPVFIPEAGLMPIQNVDGVIDSIALSQAGLSTGASTATSNDVRGLFTCTAPDGDKVYEIIAFLPDAGYKGVPQFNG